ncbi:hypothetical protein HanXRQr2_Chr06g0264811 [Helianthus annuus]|nr:hypothetical protein HanXRQr2_Chr06g0264811 [Helianthus annuus]KAJ0851203.1 hypothetical protein HanPSC8_Chr13g0589541 [Helianthus annuus]
MNISASWCSGKRFITLHHFLSFGMFCKDLKLFGFWSKLSYIQSMRFIFIDRLKRKSTSSN